jgi:hypothetical protein
MDIQFNILDSAKTPLQALRPTQVGQLGLDSPSQNVRLARRYGRTLRPTERPS